MSHRILNISSGVLVGIEGRWLPITVHLDPPSSPHQADDAVVYQALEASHFRLEHHFISEVPAALPREESSTNLTIALRLLSEEGRIPAGALTNLLPLGRLTPRGHIRPVHGTYPILRTLKNFGIEKVLVPRAAKVYASWVEGIQILAADSLAGAVRVLQSAPRSTMSLPTLVSIPTLTDDAAKGSWPTTPHVARAFDIAAAGRHHLLLVGAQGSPAPSLARRFVDLLPSPTLDEALDITAHHIAGDTPVPRTILTARPLLMPPASISASGLAGGGRTSFIPGELTLAHHGVLVLEDLPNFSTAALAAAAHALEAGELRFRWLGERVSVPTKPQVIATMTACPCGRLGHPDRHCTCTPTQLTHHYARIPKLLRDQFAMILPIPVSAGTDEMKRVPPLKMRREAIAGARQMRHFRGQEHDPFGRLTSRAVAYNDMVLTSCTLSAAARTHFVNIAASIADLRGDDEITDEDMQLARSFLDPDGAVP